MGKHKSKKKGSQLVIRIEKDEKNSFLKVCEALDTSAGREIRRFMREFVAAQTAEVKAVDAVAAPEDTKEEAVPEAPAPAEKKPKKAKRSKDAAAEEV